MNVYVRKKVSERDRVSHLEESLTQRDGMQGVPVTVGR